ncbi:TrfB-related DNA-binding protein [Dickeya sp. NCPPB 3274]|uniref:TrfB-related DNA-binding protein n=1 Tax=Dickeya sp. NCPPB 3274 TaxID=568766 RepID=UPI0005B48BB3|nr:TrfB-related DNA-binding protein [Dickeya sp. NCPPB 3274]
MKYPRYTQEEWDNIVPSLRRFSMSTVQAVHAVLVKGERQVDVVHELGLSKQSVNKALKKVLEVIPPPSSDMKFVCVFLPREEAEKVEKMALKYK